MQNNFLIFRYLLFFEVTGVENRREVDTAIKSPAYPTSPDN